jgi:hypothetical protein
MANKLNELAQSAINKSSDLNMTPLTLTQKLEGFDADTHSGEVICDPMVGKENFNTE